MEIIMIGIPFAIATADIWMENSPAHHSGAAGGRMFAAPVLALTACRSQCRVRYAFSMVMFFEIWAKWLTTGRRGR
jgi:hypothetical protein